MTSDYETTTSSILINASNRTDLAENGTGHPLTITIFFLNLNSWKFLNTFHECFFQQHGPAALQTRPRNLCHYIRRENPSVRWLYNYTFFHKKCQFYEKHSILCIWRQVRNECSRFIFDSYLHIQWKSDKHMGILKKKTNYKIFFVNKVWTVVELTEWTLTLSCLCSPYR